MRVTARLLVLLWLVPSFAFAQAPSDPVQRARQRAGQGGAAPAGAGLYEEDEQPGSAVGPEQPDPTPSPYDDDPVDEPENPEDGTLKVPVRKTGPAKKEEPKVAPTPAAKPEPQKAEPPTLVVKTLSDADLTAVWLRWRDANASKNPKAEAAARKELLATRELLDSQDVELWAMGLLRVAQRYADEGDDGAAVEIAHSAAELAPDVPATWFLLTRLYLKSDPSGVGRYADALVQGLSRTLTDPRYLRPLLDNVATVVGVAFVAVVVASLVVLLLRRGRYFLYDFHFLFPRAAARWQTTALGVLVLSLPIVFRLGVVPTLLLFFAAVTFYVSPRERVVAAVLIGALGVLPVVGGLLVEHTAFAETAAEDLYRLERSGPSLEPLAQHYEKLAAEDKVGFAERFVLGHFHLNRGHLEQAVTHLRAALRERPDDVPARVALAKAVFLQGDLENSRSLLENVRSAAPSPIALLDLSRVHQRRVQVYGDSNAGEVGKASQYLLEARQLDPTIPGTLAEVTGPELVGNTWLKTLPLPRAELLRLANGEDAALRVKSQLSQMLMGDVPSWLAPFYPLVLALLLAGLGSLSRSVEAARACNRCGRPVSHRGDPDVSPGSLMCTQCVNVFARKNVVSPSIKVRKQLEIARYESQLERVSTVLGVLFSGMGQVFAGQPVRGVLYGFFFFLAIVGFVLRGGVLRPPFEGVPVLVSVVPLALIFVVVYPLSLVRLRRKAG